MGFKRISTVSRTWPSFSGFFSVWFHLKRLRSRHRSRRTPWAMMLWSWVVRSQWRETDGSRGGGVAGWGGCPGSSSKQVGGEWKLARDKSEKWLHGKEIAPWLVIFFSERDPCTWIVSLVLGFESTETKSFWFPMTCLGEMVLLLYVPCPAMDCGVIHLIFFTGCQWYSPKQSRVVETYTHDFRWRSCQTIGVKMCFFPWS